jgi:hypothetical protein
LYEGGNKVGSNPYTWQDTMNNLTPNAVVSAVQSMDANYIPVPPEWREAANLAVGNLNKRLQGAPAPDATGTKKPLDAATAKKFLEQAKGDKNVARKLAADAGYSF